MNETKQLEEKYPTYIIEKLRNRIGEDENDSSVDDEILTMSPNEIFDHVLRWDGLIGFTEPIKKYILEIYGVDLDS